MCPKDARLGQYMKIIICVASTVVRIGVRAIVGKQISTEILAETDNFTKALRLASADSNGVVIIDDAVIKEHDVFEMLVPQINKSYTTLVALVGDADFVDLNYLLRRGVLGVVSPNEPEENILDAVRAAADGALYVSPNFAHSVTGEATMTAAVRPQLIRKLTPRELEVLDYVVEGLPNQGIAAKMILSEKTIKFHVSSILGKLALRSRAELIATVANMANGHASRRAIKPRDSSGTRQRGLFSKACFTTHLAADSRNFII
jgi:DNA-binding NarL/FixJ family response regulator